MHKTDSHTTEFEKAYNSLNPLQQRAVDTIEGPVMVIAGPGTGKTQILTLRIANILRLTDTKPENILALTFTDSGAKAMRERLRLYIHEAAYRIPIFTFHGFAQSLIRDYPEMFPRIIGGRLVTDIESISWIEDILTSSTIQELRPSGDPSYYVSHVIKIINDMKQEYITSSKLADLCNSSEETLSTIEEFHTKGAHKGKRRTEYMKAEKLLRRKRELLFVYNAYEAKLKSERRYDFNDMILETIHALQTNEELLRMLQETYQYLLADEHQDVNQSQNKIIELLTSFHDRPNLFVVGDEKQAIYRFQGASLENFLFFSDTFPGTEIVSLTDNYRSGQEILDASHELIHVEDGPLRDLRIPLSAKQKTQSSITNISFSYEAQEDAWVIENIKALVNEGEDSNDIAIIVRSNKEVEHFSSLLLKENIPAIPSSETDVLKHPVFNSVLRLIESASSPTNERALFEVLHAPYLGISTKDLAQALFPSGKISLHALIENEDELRSRGIENPAPFVRLSTILKEGRARQLTHLPHRVIEYLLKESGMIDYLAIQDPFDGGSVVKQIYDEIEKETDAGNIHQLSDCITHFNRKKEYNIPLSIAPIHRFDHGVRVMTAHKSKGLEFQHVFIPHLTDKNWGGRINRDLFGISFSRLQMNALDPLDDERRLLYVAITRGKKTVYLSHASMKETGSIREPSRLLESLKESESTIIQSAAFEEKYVPIHSITPVPERSYTSDFFKRILTERGLSATALNNYLKSPWNYLYRNVLRIPEVQSPTLQFGTILHSILEKATKYHTQEGIAPNPSMVKEWLDLEFDKKRFTEEDRARYHERGFLALTKYIEEKSVGYPKTKHEEFGIRVELPTGDASLPFILLTGKLDRIDFNDDGNVAVVIDYKSGKPRSRNEIEGKTKKADQGYKRQLVFYALLLELYGDPRFACTECMLSFIEPDARGKIREERFSITQKEIDALRSEIIRVGLEISKGAFLDAPCDPSQSEYCDFAVAFQKAIL